MRESRVKKHTKGRQSEGRGCGRVYEGWCKKKMFSGWRGTCGRGTCHLVNGVATRGTEGRRLLVFHAGGRVTGTHWDKRVTGNAGDL